LKTVTLEAARSALLEEAERARLSGPIEAPSSYFMKSPPVQYTDDVARAMVDAYIAGAAG
jgi:myo-inositol-1-phosphate synthase